MVSLVKTSIFKRYLWVLLVFVALIGLALQSHGSSDLENIGRFIQENLKQSRKADVEVIYREIDYKPLWIVQGKPSKKALNLLKLIETADSEGLAPEDYDLALRAFDNLETASVLELARADIQFTEGLIVFIDNLRNGRFAPKSLNPDQKQSRTDVLEVITAILNFNDQEEGINDLAPDFPSYAALRILLAQYQGLLEQYPTSPKLTTQLSLKKGTVSKDVLALRKILAMYGDLDPEVVQHKQQDPAEFTEELEVALKQFQDRHTLSATGVVDAQTRKALNLSIEDRIKSIKINMERMRWYPVALGSKYLIVNIPGYDLMAYTRGEVEFTIPIVVGHPTRTTPLFQANLVNIVLNPSWGVPVSIMVRDKLPKVLEDPYYLLDRGYTVTNVDGRVVNPLDVNWEEDNALHYRLRKPPGPHNDLGEMRFTLETPPNKGTNPHGIYMHGTPAKDLFEAARRAFSSGCVRVKDPRKLALWLLQDKVGWDKTKLSHEIAKGKTQVVQVDVPTPVYFTYLTVWVDDKGLAHFGDDPYGKDAELIQKMNLSAKKTKKSFNSKKKTVASSLAF